jgi:uncharacterized protein YjeT (DUF2065 family)
VPDWLWPALGLVLVCEGLMPLVNPQGWRDLFARLLRLNDGQLRFVGLCCVALGGVILLVTTA